mgnify:CR=1 FL=1
MPTNPPAEQPVPLPPPPAPDEHATVLAEAVRDDSDHYEDRPLPGS